MLYLLFYKNFIKQKILNFSLTFEKGPIKSLRQKAPSNKKNLNNDLVLV